MRLNWKSSRGVCREKQHIIDTIERGEIMNFQSIDSNVKFPDMSYYDMTKASGMALYLAHCDLYPFRSVIDNSKISLDAIGKSYHEVTKEAQKHNDFVTEQWAMTSGLLHSSRVSLYTQYSLLLIMVSLLEESLNTLCRIYHNKLNLPKELKDIKGNGLERAAKYLKDEVKVQGFTADKQWEYITAIRDARNMVVHNGGRLVRYFDKFDKFKIGYREEDKQLYLEYDDIDKMYEAILDFVNRAFKLEPSPIQINSTKDR